MTPTILLSDDDVEFCSAMRREFRPHGVEVLFDTRADVSELARALRPAVILVDLLQDRDGLSLLQELKADASTSTIPVIVMSGMLGADRRPEEELPGAMALGAFSVVPKPFPSLFVERVAALARSGAAMFGAS